jgi:hypothetical protein
MNHVVRVSPVQFAVFALLLLAGCDRSSDAESSNPNHLRADQEVTMADDSYGCEFPSKFLEAIEHREKGELSA